MIPAMIDRRYFLFSGAVSLSGLAPRLAKAAAMSRITAYAFTFKGLDGGEILLASYAGHPMLVVNTASLCGYTPQYAGLQELWTRYAIRGWSCSACRPMTLAGRSRVARPRSTRLHRASTTSPSPSPKK